MKIIKKELNKLKLAPYNPRRMSDIEFENLKNSIKKFGYVEPIIINKRTGYVVGGNQRLKALKELYGNKEIKVIEVDLSEKEEKALNLALNKISGRWDEIKLSEILNEISNDEISNDLIKYTGFSETEIEYILKQIDNNVKEIEFSEDNINNITKNKCPRCGYEW